MPVMRGTFVTPRICKSESGGSEIGLEQFAVSSSVHPSTSVHVSLGHRAVVSLIVVTPGHGLRQWTWAYELSAQPLMVLAHRQ